MRGYAGYGEQAAVGYEAGGSYGGAQPMERHFEDYERAAKQQANVNLKSVEVDRRSEVERAFDSQSAAIDRLSSVLGELRSRLTPVMVDTPEKEATAPVPAMPSTMVARGIEGRAQQIRLLADAVESMLCRLGV